MNIKTISATEARNRWFELLNLVYFKGEPFVIEKNNIPMVKLIPVQAPAMGRLPAEEVIKSTFGFLKGAKAYWPSEDNALRKRAIRRQKKLWSKLS